MKIIICLCNARVACAFVLAFFARTCAEAAPFTFTRIVQSPTELILPGSAPTLNNAGQVTVDGLAPGGGAVQRLVRGNGGALTTIAATGTSPFVAFTGGAYAINDAGEVGFSAYNDGPNSGVYRGDGVTLVTLDATTDPNIYPSINSSGTLAFRMATLSGAGIFFGDGSGPLTLVIEAGGMHTYSSVGNPSINDVGTMAFTARGQPPMGGGFPPEYIYTSTPAGVLTEVTNTTTGGWSAVGGGLADNLVLSDSGAVVFEGMKQADGRQGVYLATPSGPGYAISTIVDTTGPYASFAFNAIDGLSINASNQVAFRATLDGSGTAGIFTGPDPVADKVIAVGDTLDGKVVESLLFGRFALNDSGEIAFFAQFTGASGGGGGVYRATPSSDSGTLPPVLTMPAQGAVVSNPIAVSYTLPEVAQPGSVELNFHDGMTARILHLTGESVGTHSFSFDPASPTNSAEVSSGPSIPDGSYSVVISYQDALGNAREYDDSTGVVVDTTAPTGGTFTVTPPTVAHGTPVALAAPGWGDPHGPLSYEFFAGVMSLSPPQAGATLSGVFLPVGTHDLYAEVSDAVGNSVTLGPIAITVTSAPGTITPWLLRSDAAPTDPPDALFSVLRPPMINGAGKLSFKGNVFTRDATDNDVSPITLANDLMIWADKGSTQLALIAREGAEPPGIPGGKFIAFSDPIQTDSGAVVFKGTAKVGLGGVLALTDEAIYTDLSGSMAIVVRESDSISGLGSATYKSFTSIAATNDGVFGIAALRSGTSEVVSSANDVVLWTWEPGDVQPTIRLREGQSIALSLTATRTVASFEVLSARSGVTGQGRSFTRAGAALVRVVCTDGSTAFAKLTSDVDFLDQLEVVNAIIKGLPATPSPVPTAPAGANFATMDAPTINALGHRAFKGTVATRTTPLPAITTANDAVIWADQGSTPLALIAREGSPAPDVAGGVFGSFLDPVIADNDYVAFIGTMKTGATFGGILSSADQGIWAQTDAGLKLIAREGTTHSFLPTGTVITSFQSMVVHDRGGAFRAKLKVGVGGVTAGKDDIFVVWSAVDGAATLALREGQLIEVFAGYTGHPRKLKTFDVFTSLAPFGGVGRSFNASGQIMTYCTFIDGTTGFFGIDL